MTWNAKLVQWYFWNSNEHYWEDKCKYRNLHYLWRILTGNSKAVPCPLRGWWGLWVCGWDWMCSNWEKRRIQTYPSEMSKLNSFFQCCFFKCRSSTFGLTESFSFSSAHSTQASNIQSFMQTPPWLSSRRSQASQAETPHSSTVLQHWTSLFGTITGKW